MSLPTIKINSNKFQARWRKIPLEPVYTGNNLKKIIITIIKIVT